MNEKDYPTHHSAVGAFEVFKGQYMSGCYVKALAEKTNHERVALLAHRLLDLNDAFLRKNPKDTLYHEIRRRNVTDKRSKQDFYEVALATGASPNEATKWLEENAMDVAIVAPDREDLSVERMTVGPCRYQGNGTQYVKIRFDGFSIPLHFHAGLGSGALEGTWAEAPTLKALKEEIPKDVDSVNEIINIFKTGITTELIKKALTRPMNASRIVESGSFAPEFFVPCTFTGVKIYDGNGEKTGNFVGYKKVAKKGSKNEMADPSLHPVAVFSFTKQPEKDKYGYMTRGGLLVIVTDDDKIYTTKMVYNWYGNGAGGHYLNGREDTRWLGDECCIRQSEFKLLDDNDMFVRERAGRALSRKL